MTGKETKKPDTTYRYVADQNGVLVESTQPGRGDPSTVTRLYEEAARARRQVRSSIQTLAATVELLSLEDVFSQSVGALPHRGSKRVILVVEDDKEVADLYGRMLREADFSIEIVQAHNRATAMVCCRAFAFDLAVIDLRLPDGNGIDVAWEVRVKNPTAPILVISGALPELEDMLERRADLLAPIEVFEKTSMYACVRRVYAILGETRREVT